MKQIFFENPETGLILKAPNKNRTGETEGQEF